METIQELYKNSPTNYTFIQDVYARATRKDKFFTQEEKRRNGAKRFKRAALGFFGLKSIKTLDEMAKLFYDTGITCSVEEGKRAVPLIAGHSVKYYGLFFDHVAVEEVYKGGKKKYKVEVYDSG